MVKPLSVYNCYEDNKSMLEQSQRTKIEGFITDHLEDYLDILQQMVSINSFTTNGEGVNQLGEFTAQIFSRLGFEALFVPSIQPNFGNHLFLFHPADQNSKASSLPSLALISHLDTVFSPEEERANYFSWRREGNRIYGPGTIDIKGGTVMMLMVLETLQKFEPDLFNRIHWYLCLNASEEVLSLDFSQACLQRLPQDTLACLIFEAGNIENDQFKLVVARKGRAYFKIKSTGRSAHSGNAHQSGANAIVQLAEFIPRIASMTDYDHQITFNVGTIKGGSVVNRVPHYAEAEIEMRAFSPQTFNLGVKQVLDLDGSSSVSSYDGFPCSINVEVLESTQPWPSNPATERLYQHWQNTAKELGFEVIPEQRGGLSDGNLLWNYFPTLDGLGPAGDNAHCSEQDPQSGKEQEYVSIRSFIPKAVLNIASLVNLISQR